MIKIIINIFNRLFRIKKASFLNILTKFESNS